MSYILDALKKSESERRAGATPGLAPGASYVVLPQHRSRHRGAALMVAVGMLGTGLALGNWRPWQEDLAGGTAPPAAPIAAPVAVAVPASKVKPAPALTGAESPRSSRSESRPEVQTPPLVTPKTSTATEKKRSGPPPKEAPVFVRSEPAAEPEAASPARAPASFRLASLAPALMPAPAMAVPAAAPAPVAKAAPAVVAPAAGAGAAAAAVTAPVAVPSPPVVVPAAAPAAAPAPVSRVVAYRELPAAVQGALPNIVFGGFAGGGEAEGRIAFINNRLVREGEEVSPGLRLETVDQDGVVLGFQGHHFRTGQ